MTKTAKGKKVQGKPRELVFLVVDDDGQVRDILTGYLKSFGFTNVIEAKDGKSALKIVQNHDQRLDFVISDWEMPHIDGLTLLRAVRKDPFREDVKFLMVSSQSSRERIKISEAAKSYVDAYVVKPFRAQVLKEKIGNLIENGFDPSANDFDAEVGTVRVAPWSKTKNGSVTVEIDPNHPPETYDVNAMNVTLIINLSLAYQKVKWFEKSLSLCTEALSLFPDNADLYYQLAQTHFLSGNFAEASAVLKSVIKLSPYHVEGRTLMAELAGKKKAA